MVPLPKGDQLHIKRFRGSSSSAPILMLPSLMEDGKVFYSNTGKGLAPYLAKQGYDVFVADFRGKGRSWPCVSAKSNNGYHQAICEDIPALVKTVTAKHGVAPQYWVAHGTAGSWLASFLARYPDQSSQVAGIVYFGSRRQLTVGGISRYLIIDLLWRQVGAMAVKLQGFLPAKRLKLGSADETKRTYQDAIKWEREGRWIDPEDGFDYGVAAQEIAYPPSLYFAALGDKALGHVQDVRRFIFEMGDHNGRLVLLGKKLGNKSDYSHVGQLIQDEAVSDHFMLLVEWLQEIRAKKSLREKMTSAPAVERVEHIVE